MSKEKHTCCAEVHHGKGWHSYKVACGCKASIEREGKWYCKRHDPVAIKEKDKARREKWDQKWEESKKEQRLKNAAPDMLAALKLVDKMLSDVDGFEFEKSVVKAAIAKTEGKK